ncbi:MAG TPA: hypothetical protein VIK84_06245 [Haloplasmataceae bacterium]
MDEILTNLNQLEEFIDDPIPKKPGIPVTPLYGIDPPKELM